MCALLLLDAVVDAAVARRTVCVGVVTQRRPAIHTVVFLALVRCAVAHNSPTPPATPQEKDHAITLEALDVLGEVMARYGTLLAAQHKDLQDTLLRQLAHSRPAVRKRAIGALGVWCQPLHRCSMGGCRVRSQSGQMLHWIYMHCGLHASTRPRSVKDRVRDCARRAVRKRCLKPIAQHCRACHCITAARLVPVEADQLFTSLMETLIDRLRNSADDEATQTCVQCITAIKYAISFCELARNRAWYGKGWRPYLAVVQGGRRVHTIGAIATQGHTPH